MVCDRIGFSTGRILTTAQVPTIESVCCCFDFCTRPRSQIRRELATFFEVAFFDQLCPLQELSGKNADCSRFFEAGRRVLLCHSAKLHRKLSRLLSNDCWGSHLGYLKRICLTVYNEKLLLLQLSIHHLHITNRKLKLHY